jgi:hypothetical protein
MVGRGRFRSLKENVQRFEEKGRKEQEYSMHGNMRRCLIHAGQLGHIRIHGRNQVGR